MGRGAFNQIPKERKFVAAANISESKLNCIDKCIIMSYVILLIIYIHIITAVTMAKEKKLDQSLAPCHLHH